MMVLVFSDVQSHKDFHKECNTSARQAGVRQCYRSMCNTGR